MKKLCLLIACLLALDSSVEAQGPMQFIVRGEIQHDGGDFRRPALCPRLSGPDVLLGERSLDVQLRDGFRHHAAARPRRLWRWCRWRRRTLLIVVKFTRHQNLKPRPGAAAFFL